MIRTIFIFFLLFIQSTPSFAQITENKITSISWENNSLIIHTTGKTSYAESLLKDPDRLIVDILNCSLQDKSLEKNFRSEQGENVSISEPANNQIRIIFEGPASINRKSYLTNFEKTLIIRIARVDSEDLEEKIAENLEQTSLEKYTPGNLKEINVEENNEETEIIISSTKSIKYDYYLLKNPERCAIDLLNVLPPKTPLPKFNPTKLVTSIRVGRAASGVNVTRVVIDLAKADTSCEPDTSLLGNKLKIKIRPIVKERTKKSSIKVVIDPGHGGYDTGASYGGFEEKDINLIISEKLKKTLEDYGITVFLTRDEDSFLSLAERVEITNSIRPDVFISVHNNALKTSKSIRGVETYYWSHLSQKLAYYVHKSILNNIKIPDHYIRKARFYVIRHTPVPAVLAELGFLSNHDDRQLLTSTTTQDQYAKALSEAILKFLDLDTKPEKKKQ